VKRWIRFASACAVAVAALGAAGCSSSPAEAPQIEGKSPAEYREEMDQKISHPLGDPPPPTSKKRSSGRR
jgi:hypothetical protein